MPPNNQQEVEVLYADGMWHRSWWSSLILTNFHGLQSFTIDDNETTEVNFPSEEVRIVS